MPWLPSTMVPLPNAQISRLLYALFKPVTCTRFTPGPCPSSFIAGASGLCNSAIFRIHLQMLYMELARYLLFCFALLCFTEGVAQRTRIRNNLTYKIQGVNDSLAKYSRNGQQLKLENDSVFLIVLPRQAFFRVNIFRLLKQNSSDDPTQAGIRFEPQRPLSKTENSFIRFRGTAPMGHLSFWRTNDDAVKNSYYQMLEIADLMRALSR